MIYSTSKICALACQKSLQFFKDPVQLRKTPETELRKLGLPMSSARWCSSLSLRSQCCILLKRKAWPEVAPRGLLSMLSFVWLLSLGPGGSPGDYPPVVLAALQLGRFSYSKCEGCGYSECEWLWDQLVCTKCAVHCKLGPWEGQLPSGLRVWVFGCMVYLICP
eukprot:1145251-Pelagomonas_calceolata.AAC.1